MAKQNNENRPIKLYFTKCVRMRGEHLAGENQVNDDGSINMIVVDRGETRIVTRMQALDLIISEQAIDLENSKPHQIQAAKDFVAAELKTIKLSERDATETKAAKASKVA